MLWNTLSHDLLRLGSEMTFPMVACPMTRMCDFAIVGTPEQLTNFLKSVKVEKP